MQHLTLTIDLDARTATIARVHTVGRDGFVTSQVVTTVTLDDDVSDAPITPASRVEPVLLNRADELGFPLVAYRGATDGGPVFEVDQTDACYGAERLCRAALRTALQGLREGRKTLHDFQSYERHGEDVIVFWVPANRNLYAEADYEGHLILPGGEKVPFEQQFSVGFDALDHESWW